MNISLPFYPEGRGAERPADLSPPWCDCKVAYGVDDCEKFKRWIERTDWCAGLLPPGWQLIETDGAGARMVAIFRIEGMPTAEDGRTVYRLLAKHGGYREKRQPRRLPDPNHPFSQE